MLIIHFLANLKAMLDFDKAIKALTIGFVLIISLVGFTRITSGTTAGSGFGLALVLLLAAPVLIVATLLGISSLFGKKKSPTTGKTSYDLSIKLIVLGIVTLLLVYLLVLA